MDKLKNISDNKNNILRNFQTEFINILQSIKNRTDAYVEIITSIENTFGYFDELYLEASGTIDDIFILINNSEYINSLIKIVNQDFAYIANTSDNINVIKPFITNAIILTNSTKKLMELDAKVFKIGIDELFNFVASGKNIIPNFEKLLSKFRLYIYTWDLYIELTKKVVDNYASEESIINAIMDLNESNKDFILGYASADNDAKIDKELVVNNPWLKTYGLIPISKGMSIEKIAEIVFKAKAKSIEELEKLCKKHDSELIITKKIATKCIEYDVLDLLDYGKSKAFEASNRDGDGITLDVVKRFNNIKYINPTDPADPVNSDLSNIVKDGQKAKNKVLIQKAKNKVLILEEICINAYHILSNSYNTVEPEYTVGKSSVKKFIEFAQSADNSKRIHNYNNLFNKKVMSNMFLGTLPDLKQVENRAEKVVSMDPKYLRNTIYNSIISKYKELVDSEPSIKEMKDFTKIIYSNEFEQIFSDTIMQAYFEYLKKTNSALISTIYVSFLSTMNTYERDFSKKLHDNLVEEIKNISEVFKSANEVFKSTNEVFKSANEVFKSTNKDKTGVKKNDLFAIFDKILKPVINDIISADSNLFRDIDYKTRIYEIR